MSWQTERGTVENIKDEPYGGFKEIVLLLNSTLNLYIDVSFEPKPKAGYRVRLVNDLPYHGGLEPDDSDHVGLSSVDARTLIERLMKENP